MKIKKAQGFIHSFYPQFSLFIITVPAMTVKVNYISFYSDERVHKQLAIGIGLTVGGNARMIINKNSLPC